MKERQASLFIGAVIVMLLASIIGFAFHAITDTVRLFDVAVCCALVAAETVICMHFGTIVIETSKLNESFNNWIVYGIWLISLSATLLVIYLAINPQPEVQLL